MSEYTPKIYTPEIAQYIPLDYVNKLEAFEKERGQPFETIPFHEKQHLILERLNVLVQVLKQNPLWKSRLEEAGIDEIQSWGDWYRIPITTRREVREWYTATKKGVVKGIPYIPIASGGSSGEQIVTLYGLGELELIGKRAGAFWRRNIFSPEVEDRRNVTFLNLFYNRNGWGSDRLVQPLLEGTGFNAIPAGEISLGRVADFYLTTQGVTEIAGLPSDILHLIEILERDGYKEKYNNVRRIFYGGEFLDPSVEDRIKQWFPKAKIIAVYSSTQADHIGVEVDERGVFRLTDEINLVEIVDEEGNPLPPGEVGRIVVTRLMGNGVQPLRLDLQDKGKIIIPDPEDPLQARKLVLYGREGDYVRVSTWDIKAGDLLRTTHRLLVRRIPSDKIRARQLVLSRDGLTLFVAVDDPHKFSLSSEDQRRIMEEAIFGSLGFFEDPHGDIPPGMQLEIKFVTIEKLRKTPTGKIHPFINERDK